MTPFSDPLNQYISDRMSQETLQSLMEELPEGHPAKGEYQDLVSVANWGYLLGIGGLIAAAVFLAIAVLTLWVVTH